MNRLRAVKVIRNFELWSLNLSFFLHSFDELASNTTKTPLSMSVCIIDVVYEVLDFAKQ